MLKMVELFLTWPRITTFTDSKGHELNALNSFAAGG